MAENLILTGGIFHPFEEASVALAEILDEVGIHSTITQDIEQGLKDIAALGRYDLLTVYALRWRMIQHEKYVPYRDEWQFSLSRDGQDAIRSFVERGGGLLGLHTASICFDDWPEWGSILGGAWDWGRSFHPDLGPLEVKVAPNAHPITAGIDDFIIEDEIYHYLSLESDIEPLLSAQATPEDGPQPLCWARDYGRGRVVYDSLAHDATSVRHPAHQHILKRSALWAMKRSNTQVEAA